MIFPRRLTRWTASLLLGLSCLVVAGGCSPERKKARHLERAQAFLAAQDRASAEIELLNVLRLDVRDAAANRELGRLYIEQGRVEKALPHLAAARHLLPTDADARRELALAWLSASRLEEARTEALALLQLRPDDPAGWLLLAEASNTPEHLRAARELLRPANHGGALDVLQETALAVLDLRERRLDVAEAALRRLIERHPNESPPHAVLATLLLVRGGHEEARTMLARAAELAGPRSPRRLFAARMLLRSGDGQRANRIIDTTCEAAPDYLPAQLLRVELALQRGDVAAAETILAEVRNIDSGLIEARVLTARIQLARGEFGPAETELNALAQLLPQSGQIHHLLALAQLGGPNHAAAPATLARAVSLMPENVDAILLLASLDIRRDKPAAAVVALQALTQKQPRLEAAWSLLAEAYERQGNHVAALETLATAHRQFPERPQPLTRQATLLRKLGRTDEARTRLAEALALDASYAPAVEQYIELDLAARDQAAARRRAEGFAAAYPNQPEAYLLLAQVAAAMSDHKTAETALRAVIKLRPENPRPYVLLAHLLIGHGRAEEALRELEDAAALDSRDHTGRMLIGMISQQRGDIARARRAYESVLALQPGFVHALNNLAYIYSEHDGELARARELAERARKLAPQDPHVLDTLGWILFQQGEYTWARNLFVESAAKLTGVPEVQAHLGLSHYMLGEIEAALPALHAYLASDPTGKLAEEARRCVALLEADARVAGAELSELAAERLQQRPADAVAVLQLAIWHEHHQRPDEARKILSAGLQVQPRNPRLRQAWAEFLHRRGEIAEAVSVAQQNYRDHPGDFLAARTMARFAFQQREYVNAANIYREILRHRLADAALYREAATAQLAIGDLAAANVAWQGMLASNSTEDQAQAREALLLLEYVQSAREPAPLSTAVAAAISAAPEESLTRLARARQLLAKGDAAAAADEYEAVLRLYPLCHVAALPLAEIHAETPAQRSRALQLAQQVRTAQPDNARAARLLGLLALRAGEHDRAVTLLTEAMLKQTDDARVCVWLGDALQSLQRLPEARAAWRRALERGLTGTEAAELQQRLNETPAS